MSRSRFESNSDWHQLVEEIEKRIENCRDAVLNAKSFDEVRHLAGYVDALRAVLDLPNVVLKNAEDEEPELEQPTDAIRLAPVRLSNRY